MTALATTAVLVVTAAVLAPAPAGADVIRLDPLYEAGPTDTLNWAVTELTDDGYAMGFGLLGGSFTVWGPDVGTVFGSDLIPPGPGLGSPSISALAEGGVVAGQYVDNTPLAPHPPFVADLHDRQAVLLDTGPFLRAQVTAMNRSGTVVGYLYQDAPTVDTVHAAAWVGPNHDLVLLDDGGESSLLGDVNDDGVAGGWMRDAGGDQHPITWDVEGGGPPIDLAPITGFQISGASDVVVNARGDVLVQLGNGAGNYGHDVVVDHATGQAIDAYPAGTGYGAKLNDRGEVASMIFAVPGDRPARFEILDLPSGSRREVATDATSGSLFTFNDRGQVGATRTVGGDPPAAMLWDPFRGWIDIGDGDGRGAHVWSMSSSGLVGGAFADTGSPWIATVQLAPEPPRSVVATAAGGSVEVGWAPPVSPGDAAVTTYRISRNGVAVADVAATATTFVEPYPVTPGQAVTYNLTAINEFGESLPSAAATVVIPELPTPSVPPSTAAVPVAARPTFAG